MKRFNELYKFMTHRYGADELNVFLFIIYIIGFITSLFIKVFILDLAVLFLFIVIVYRFFSKKLEKRSKENKVYLKIRNFIVGIFNSKKRNKKKDDYIYKKCSKCKTVLRLPLPAKRGIKHVKCPKCDKRLTLFVLRKLKVEYIRKGETK